MDRGHPSGNRQQDLQQYHVWTTIQDNQQTPCEMPIWIHTWSRMPRRLIHYQDTSTSKTQPQPSNMGDIRRPSQGLQYLQSRTSHCHTRKIWRPPKTTLRDQTHVRQKYSQAHHQKGGDIHRIQSGCQTRRQHGPGTISVMNDGLLRNTRRQVDGVGTKKIPIRSWVTVPVIEHAE